MKMLHANNFKTQFSCDRALRNVTNISEPYTCKVVFKPCNKDIGNKTIKLFILYKH